MNFEQEFAALQFVGGSSIAELQVSCAIVPNSPGVYTIVRQGAAPVQFLEASTGGRFKGRNPSVPVAKLVGRWVPSAGVLYIGKAGGAEQRATLRSRLSSYVRFGQGVPCAHWGGRYIWQLADAAHLKVFWARSANPAITESHLLSLFRQSYSSLPFANLRR